MKVYKYRANLLNEKTNKRRDTESLINYEFYAARFAELNDPFESSVELPKSDKHEHWVTPILQDIYNVGIYSLSKPRDEESFPTNELLWVHYANSHKGFCIEYDLEELTDTRDKDFNIKGSVHVSYVNERPEIIEKENTFSIQKKVFGTKSLPWNYENEIRLIFEKSGVKRYSKSAITGIYFGLNINSNERNFIIKEMKNNKVKFYQIIRIDNKYKLYYSELNDTDTTNYKIIRQSNNLTVENYNILYLGVNKDRITIQNLVNEFRKGKQKPTNITIYDDIRVDKCIDKLSSNTTEEEKKLLAEHWIAYASFESPEAIWMYPER